MLVQILEGKGVAQGNVHQLNVHSLGFKSRLGLLCELGSLQMGGGWEYPSEDI